MSYRLRTTYPSLQTIVRWGHYTSNHGFTSTGKPWVIKYFDKIETKSEALKRETQLKNWKNRTALEELIAGD